MVASASRAGIASDIQPRRVADCGALLVNVYFNFWKSRLLQLLIQRGQIGFE